MSDTRSMSNKEEHARLAALQEMVEIHWGVEDSKIDRLMGYEIATYCVESAGKRYILKQYPDTLLYESQVQFENQVLEHLRHSGHVPSPALIKTKENGFLVRNNNALFRLQSYLRGTFLAEAKLSESVLCAIGESLGVLDRKLRDIPGPYPLFDQSWDLKHSSRHETLLPYITEPANRRLAAYFLHQFKAEVLPKQYELPEQLIHADANEWNVLIEEEAVSGIIDFGDMCYSWRINELAIGLAYTLMFSDKPLEDAVPVIKGYHTKFVLTDSEVDVLYYLVAVRLAISVCWSAKNKIDQPENAYFGISEAGAWKLLHRWIQINPVMFRKKSREAIGLQTEAERDIAAMRAQRHRFLSRSLSLSYKTPIPMVRSALQYMYDANGKTYLDAYNNIMLVGHSHPQVLEAGMRTYNRINTNTRYLYDELTAYAEQLLSHFPPGLCRVFFVNSGSAAADLALRMSYHHTGGKNVIALEEGYHGNTVTTIAASPYKYKKSKTASNTLALELPNAYELKDDSHGDPGTYYAARAITRIHQQAGDIAAFIAEPIVGCGGQVPLPAGYLQKIYPQVRAAGGVCISDEVQVGFGRLGKVFWGFELQEVVPDIVILGKPMGNGHPIGAVVTTKEIAASFESGPEFFSSFGGNPVSCAIGTAVLEVIREEALQQHALEVGTFLKAQLLSLANEHTAIADVRGEGLFIGVEIADDAGNPDGIRAENLTNTMKDFGVLVSTDGPFNQVIKIKPPLCFSRKDAEKFVRIFRSSLINTGVN